MNIVQAKQQVKDTIEAYSMRDETGRLLMDASRQRPVFLVGAPGVGKTAIMEQIAQELEIGLVSYSMTHHTRQSALGLPFIVHEEYDGVEYEASEYTMSEIIASVYAYMRKTKVERGILFLDEINCVSETLYPSMLQFLQFKTFGRHAIPEGWVIVTAGNPAEYNKSVHEFDIVTLDRVKKISIEPDYQAWKSYAVAKGTHPAILSFLEVKKSRFYTIEASLDGKSFVTARGWDDLSEMMTLFERMGKTVDYDLIVQYVQHETIAREFATYCDLFSKYRDDYRIEDILAGEAGVEILERAASAQFDERLSLLGLVLDALCGDMQVLVQAADGLVVLRDDIQSIKATVECGGGVQACLTDIAHARAAQLELSSAAGTLSKNRRGILEQELQDLASFTLLTKKCTNETQALALVSNAFSSKADLLHEQAADVEEKLSHAFAFVGAAFEDQQEMLLFVTELTARTTSARYIAQFGSTSYFSHNSTMIGSERQRELRQRIEDLSI